MIIDKNSWHFKWYRYYTSILKSSYEDKKFKDTYYNISNESIELPADFCSYWRAVLLWPFIQISLNLILVTAIGLLLYIGGASLFSGSFIVIFSIISFIAILIVLALIIESFDKIKEIINNDEFVKNVSKSYNDKFCSLVTYKDSTNDE